VKSSNVSYNDIDIAVAKYASKALTIEDKDKRNAAINEIVTNSDFKNSIFIDILSNIASDEFIPEDPNKDLPSSKEPEVEGD
jgi:hypothetical protein